MRRAPQVQPRTAVVDQEVRAVDDQARDRAGGAIKLSPASNFGGKFDDVEIELVSLHGECKEATIWFGSLATPGLYRATVLPAGETLAADPLSEFPEQGPLAKYLYDPDPAIVRSGLVDVRRPVGDGPLDAPFLRDGITRGGSPACLA